MPDPREGESQDEFVSRCVPIVIEDQKLDAEDEDDRKQAVAICFSMWRRAKGEKAMELETDAIKFVGSPRNPYGTHSSAGFPGGRAGWQREWRIYLSGVQGTGPIQGTVRRVSMIAAGMKPVCNLPEMSAESVGPRQGPAGRMGGKIHHGPSDYGMERWKDPSDDGKTREDVQLSCQDLKDLKRFCLQEIAKRQQQREKAAVIVKGWDGRSMTIGGYGVVWGGKDMDGDYFAPATDFWFDRITESPMVLYDHGRDGAVKSIVVGKVSSKAPDDVGLWIEAQLDRAAEYAEAITELVETGKLGWSSGAVSHLVEREPNGYLRSWPIAEFSLTPAPCEPRTLGVQALRSLAEADPAVKAVLPKGDVVDTLDTEASGATVAEGPDEARIGRAKALSLDIELSMEE